MGALPLLFCPRWRMEFAALPEGLAALIPGGGRQSLFKAAGPSLRGGALPFWFCLRWRMRFAALPEGLAALIPGGGTSKPL